MTRGRCERLATALPSRLLEDQRYMRQALTLGKNGVPAPNPHVGAVIVRSGSVVGSGWHERAGTAHAEIVALRRAGFLARGATLYVTLEPCNHFGRTPPCVDAILRAGIARVVIGTHDPNWRVAGGGVARLTAAGIEVVASVLEKQASTLISDWVASLTPQLQAWSGGFTPFR